MRLTYIHAYQSFLWNTVVSKRLSKFGPIPIVGDLVFAPGTSGECEVDAEMEMMNEESIAVEPENDQSGDKEANGDKEADGVKSKAKAQRNQCKVIFIDENNIKDYTINDIILPLPGFDITYPANEVAGWYTELLEADGLTEMDFKQSTKYVLFFCFISFSILYHKLKSVSFLFSVSSLSWQDLQSRWSVSTRDVKAVGCEMEIRTLRWSYSEPDPIWLGSTGKDPASARRCERYHPLGSMDFLLPCHFLLLCFTCVDERFLSIWQGKFLDFFVFFSLEGRKQEGNKNKF